MSGSRSPVDPLLAEVNQRVAELDAVGRRANIAVLHGCRQVVKDLVNGMTPKGRPNEFMDKLKVKWWSDIRNNIALSYKDPAKAQMVGVEGAIRIGANPQEEWRKYVSSGLRIVDSLDLSDAVGFLDDFRRLGLIGCVEKWREMIAGVPEAKLVPDGYILDAIPVGKPAQSNGKAGGREKGEATVLGVYNLDGSPVKQRKDG